MSVVTRFALAHRLRSGARRRSIATAALAVATAATLAACGGASDTTGLGGGRGGGGGGGGGGGVTVSSVSVSPTSATIQVGATTTLTGSALDASGNTVSGQTITWSSDATGVATVNSSGVVTGVTAGTAHITAATAGKQAQSTITVTPAAVASVTLNASKTSIIAFMADSMNLGAATVTATLKDAAGNVLTGRTITWASSDTNVAQVNANGLVQAISGGTATITAASGGVSGSTQITVTMPAVAHISVTPAYDTVHVGQTATLNVVTYDANMNAIVPVSHNRSYPSLIQVTITQNGDVISKDPQYGNVFHGDNPGDAVVTFADVTGGIGIRAKITVIP